MIILGITGTSGAGKGVIVSYLEKKGFAHFSARDFILQEVRKRGLPENRDSNIIIGNELRRDHSPSYIIERLYDSALENGKDAVLESVRNPGEVDYLKSHESCYLISVDADRQTRFERIMERGGAFDRVTYEQFSSQDAKEMDATDPNKQNISECMRRADFKVINSGTFEDLYEKVDQILEALLRSSQARSFEGHGRSRSFEI